MTRFGSPLLGYDGDAKPSSNVADEAEKFVAERAQAQGYHVLGEPAWMRDADGNWIVYVEVVSPGCVQTVPVETAQPGGKDGGGT